MVVVVVLSVYNISKVQNKNKEEDTFSWCYSGGDGQLSCLGCVKVMDKVYGGGQCVWRWW